MKGKHRRSAERRDAERLAQMQATYTDQMRGEAAEHAAEQESLREQIEAMTTEREWRVARMAAAAVDAARSDAHEVEEAAARSRRSFITMTLDAMFSGDPEDEAWRPTEQQRQMVADALGIPIERVLAREAQ